MTGLIDSLNRRWPYWPCAAVALASEVAALLQLLTTDGPAPTAVALPIGISLVAGVLGILVDLEVVSSWKATLTVGAGLGGSGCVISGPASMMACLVTGIAVVWVAVYQAGSVDRSRS